MSSEQLDAVRPSDRNDPDLRDSESADVVQPPTLGTRPSPRDGDGAATVGEATPTARRSTRSVHLLLLLMTVVWGSNLPMIKISMQEMRPLAFTSVRFVLACVILLVVQLVRRESIRVPRRDLRSMVLVGFTAYAGYQYAFSHGIAKASAGTSSLILAIVPILVALLGVAFKTEKLTWRGWAGVLACLAGIVVVVLGGSATLALGNLSGDALILAAAGFWAISTILTRPLLGRYSPTALTAVTMIVGTLILVPLALPDILQQDWGAISTRAWFGVLYSGALASAFANILWNVGLRRIGGAGTAVYANVTPIFSIVAAWFMLGERITWVQLIGAAVVFVGLSLTQTEKAAPVVLPQGKGAL